MYIPDKVSFISAQIIKIDIVVVEAKNLSYYLTH